MKRREPMAPLVPSEWRDIKLSVASLTLGEAAAAEEASGLDIGELASGAHLRLLALYVHGLRTYDVPPSWSELSSLKVVDVSSSRSRLATAGRPKASRRSQSATPTG